MTPKYSPSNLPHVRSGRTEQQPTGERIESAYSQPHVCVLSDIIPTLSTSTVTTATSTATSTVTTTTYIIKASGGAGRDYFLVHPALKRLCLRVGGDKMAAGVSSVHTYLCSPRGWWRLCCLWWWCRGRPRRSFVRCPSGRCRPDTPCTLPPTPRKNGRRGSALHNEVRGHKPLLSLHNLPTYSM